MYSADATTAHTRHASAQKMGGTAQAKHIHRLIAIPPIQDETFKGELEPPSSVLPAGRYRR